MIATWYFITSLILIGYGLASPHPVLDLNVNAIWGVVLALFGTFMLGLAMRSTSTRR